MNSFIGWVGGKRLLRKTIIALMPEHKTYVEVFGGGGWVLFGKDQSDVEVYNDFNPELVNLFRTVRDRLPDFKTRLIFLLSSREEYVRFQRIARTGGEFKSEVDRAIAFYYLIRNSFGSGILTGWGFSPSQPPRPLMTKDLETAADRLRNVYIDNLSFERLITNWDRKETLFYCDPPYRMLLDKKGRSYYQCTFSLEDHTRLRDVLRGVAGRVIISYDDHPEVRELYKGFNITETKPVLYTMNRRPGAAERRVSELIITNFEVKNRLKS